MKICVHGANTIGRYGGVSLAEAGAGAEVSPFARGPQVAAMRANGVRLLMGDAQRLARVTWCEDARKLGVHQRGLLSQQSQAA